jgi:Uma2 family endonuclease
MTIASTTTTSKLVTAEELFAMGDIGRCELIAGEIIHMAPAGAEHGGIAAELLVRIKQFVDANRIGKVYAAETGFTITRAPDSTRAPDVAFVQSSRLPKAKRRGFFDGPPDLAVEVMSPSDRVSEVLAKVDQWLDAGTQSVWIVDPPNRSIEIYRRGAQPVRYRAGETLKDEVTLPGFVLDIDSLFSGD